MYTKIINEGVCGAFRIKNTNLIQNHPSVKDQFSAHCFSKYFINFYFWLNKFFTKDPAPPPPLSPMVSDHSVLLLFRLVFHQGFQYG